IAVILKKGQFRNPPAFLPSPLLRAGKQPRQGESIPPDKLFRPAESALVVLIIWILLEIVSNLVQQTPPKLKIGIGSRNGVGAKCRHKCIPPKKSGICKDSPRSAWLLVCQYNYE